jgi:hypothetical protein
MVDEKSELDSDPKIKYFGRLPGPIIPVRLTYTPEPTELL